VPLQAPRRLPESRRKQKTRVIGPLLNCLDAPLPDPIKQIIDTHKREAQPILNASKRHGAAKGAAQPARKPGKAEKPDHRSGS